MASKKTLSPLQAAKEIIKPCTPDCRICKGRIKGILAILKRLK